MSLIDPQVALTLRIRTLEAIVRGVSTEGDDAAPASTLGNGREADQRTLIVRAEAVHERMEKAIEGSAELKSFIQDYDRNAPLLSYEFASPNSAVESGAASAEPGTEGAITASSLVAPQAKAALLFEAESEMRALERDLTEIERLDERGVVGPGKLADLEKLRPDLRAALASQSKRAQDYTTLERNIGDLLERYDDYVDNVSRVFIHFDEVLSDLETRVTRAERSRVG